MKKLLLLFVLIASVGRSQTSGCNMSGFSPMVTFSTGLTANHTTTVPTQSMYLCNNSTVYDTTNQICRVVVVMPNAKYTVRSGPCITNVWALANSTIVVKPGSVGNTLTFTVEPGVTIVNNSTLTINTFTCTSILTPSAINCSTATAVNEITGSSNGVSVYPNPANDKITIEQFAPFATEMTVGLYNQLGETVYLGKSTGNKTEIDTRTFASGVYFLAIRAGELKTVKKIVINK